MSLDITLTQLQNTTVFDSNITHNLTEMADEAGIYKPIWRSEECGIITASQMIPFLINGIKELKQFPERYKKYNPENGWGDYEMFIEWLENYLWACKQYPNASINTDR